MHTIQLKDGHTASLYFSAQEITAGRHAEFQHYMMLDAGVGSDSGAADRHFHSVSARIAAAQEDPAQLVIAADALTLLHHCFTFMATKFQPRQLAFGALVGLVDGVVVDDLSEEGLTALIARLSGYGLTQGQIIDATAEFSKKKPLN